jgi:hypothetical protein
MLVSAVPVMILQDTLFKIFNDAASDANITQMLLEQMAV